MLVMIHIDETTKDYQRLLAFKKELYSEFQVIVSVSGSNSTDLFHSLFFSEIKSKKL